MSTQQAESNASRNTKPIPVTILTGFLGSGKTTLLNRILQEQHGHRIAVIENEFGEAGVDNEILLQDSAEQIVEMNNGCICCTVRGDLVRILGELTKRHRDAALERVIIETTGLADPAPVAQTFFAEQSVSEDYLLDSIITVVDALHAPRQLSEHHEAQEQVGFADRLLVSKTDLVSDGEAASLIERLRRMNPRAPIKRVHFGQTEIAELLDVRGFNLNSILEIDPAFLEEVGHRHDDEISSLAWREDRPLDLEKLEAFLDGLIRFYGQDLLRYKGVLNIAGEKTRLVFQGVHMMMGGSPGKPWRPQEKRSSVLVFIGRNLPHELLRTGLATCIAGVDEPVEPGGR
jgi:G3E family GTPase